MEGFFERDEIEPKEWLSNAWEATVSTFFENESGNSSGVLISPFGHMLTALHTIRWLLKKSYIMQDEDITQHELLKSRVLNQSPPNLFLNSLYIKEYDLRNPKVIFLGKGLHVLRGTGIKELPESFISAASNDHQDFAIVKFETAQKLPFVQLESVELKSDNDNDNDIYHISTPMMATRQNNKSAKGNIKYITFGRTGDLKYSECIDSNDESIQSRTKLFYDKCHQFCSADHAPGSSGGPFFDSHGNLLGISTIGLYKSNQEYKRFGTGFLKSSYIMQQIPLEIQNEMRGTTA